MHKTQIPQSVIDQITKKRGKRHVFDDLDPTSTALLVVDLQNGYMLKGVAHALMEGAIEIVPNVNRIAAAFRQCGGSVFWLGKIVTAESLKGWSVHHELLCRPEHRNGKIETMREGGEGHKFWHDLDIKPNDQIVYKTRYSAFAQDASNLESKLRARGIDTVVIVGTSTCGCCDSTARDAMMRNLKTIMISDATATRTDEQHNAALTAFYRHFGDVMTTDELIGYIHANAKTTAA